MEDFKTRLKQVCKCQVSFWAEMGLTCSTFNYVNFNLLAVHREAASLEQLLGLCKINLSHAQALAEGCCSAQADAFSADIPSWSWVQKAESWICPGDRYVLPSSGFIFLGLAEMDLQGEIRRSVILLICKYHSVSCIVRWGSDHGRYCSLPQSAITTAL